MTTKTLHNQKQLLEIQETYNRIGIWYDLVNWLSTLGFKNLWHKSVSEFLLDRGPLRILDLGCGTASQIISLFKTKVPIISATGIDISERMLQIARKKIERYPWQNSIFLLHQDMHSLNFEDCFFDALTLTFGINYSTNTQKLFKESARVLKPDCPLIIIEFINPNSLNPLHPFSLYIKFILPAIGRLISGAKEAYRKIAQSVNSVPDQKLLYLQLKASGFQKITVYRLFPGFVTLYCAKRCTS